MRRITIHKIVLFTLFTIGILYIIVYFNEYNTSIEGFQISASGCNLISVGSQTIYLCSTESDAINVLSSPGYTNAKVCYTNTSNEDLNVPGLNNTTFVCFDNNGEPTFDEETQKYIEFDPIVNEDTLPMYAEQDAIANRSAFNSGYNSFISAHNNVSTLRVNASTMGYAHTWQVRSTMQSLSNQRCVGTIAPAYQNACSKMATSIATMDGILNDRTDNSLFNMNTVLENSRSKIKNYIYKDFIPGFFNSRVMSTPQIVDYNLNK
jgi:hypothetical protein